jgi:D-alanyl-D-alanine carboxypeptidase
MILADMDDGVGVVVCMNGPGDPAAVAEYVLQLMHAVADGTELPAVPPASSQVAPDAASYAGVYTGSKGESLTVVADERGRLFREHRGEKILLEMQSEDRFYANHPAFAKFLIGFERDAQGAVEVFHGSHWFRAERYKGAIEFRHPRAWDAFPGHYRSYSPWFPTFRVVLRKGTLWFVDPESVEKPLKRMGPGMFQIGGSNSAERIRFSALIRGPAQRADVSGAPYYRVSSQD